jgi:glycosyltransferase involved in cell wall biosynthesis
MATHNRRDRLVAMLDSLRAQTVRPERFEVIVVDDASSDGTEDELAHQAARGDLDLKVIRRGKGGGPAVARNEGWRAASADLVAFTDDDCVTVPGWLEAGLAAHAAAPEAFLQGPVGPIPDEVELRSATARTVIVDSLGPYYQTCNIFYPRTLLERLDGFDENFPAPGGEDTDLAWRALEQGVEAKWVPEAQVYHAVNELGVDGLMKLARRWAPSMEVYIRHPGLREQVFNHRFFWKPQHYMLFRVIVGLALPGKLRSWFLALLAWPYLMYLLKPGRQDGGGPLSAPIVALYDVVEMSAVARWALKRKKLIL